MVSIYVAPDNNYLFVCLITLPAFFNIRTSRAPIAGGESSLSKYVPEEIKIVDYYPETADGNRKLYVAIIWQGDYRKSDDFDPQLRLVLCEIASKIVGDPDICGEWPEREWRLYLTENYYDDFSKFLGYICSIDKATDGDDRIILFIVGHGSYSYDNGTYYFRLEDETLIPDTELYRVFETLGPALDFIWMLSCESVTTMDYSVQSDLREDLKDYIFWGYTDIINISYGLSLYSQAKEFLDGLRKDITIIEELNLAVSNFRRKQIDHWVPGTLNISKLGPVYDEKSTEDIAIGIIWVPMDISYVDLPY